MPQVQLSDQIFNAAQRRASDGGYSSVDEYIADVLVHDLADDALPETPNLDHLFTPACLAEIDEADAEIKAGNSFTTEQVREHFIQKRVAWQQKSSPR